MDIEEYLKDPCGASSLPYWKTESLTLPDSVRIVRDDRFDSSLISGIYTSIQRQLRLSFVFCGSSRDFSRVRIHAVKKNIGSRA